MNNASDSDSDDNKLLMQSDNDDRSKLSANKLLQLPVSRVKTIMKSSPDLGNVSPESYFLITQATELFVKYLAKHAYSTSNKSKTVEYKSLAKLVSTDECLDFLEEIVPFKIKMKDYWEKYGKPIRIDDNDHQKITTNGNCSGVYPMVTSPISNSIPKHDTSMKSPTPLKSPTTSTKNTSLKSSVPLKNPTSLKSSVPLKNPTTALKNSNTANKSPTILKSPTTSLKNSTSATKNVNTALKSPSMGKKFPATVTKNSLPSKSPTTGMKSPTTSTKSPSTSMKSPIPEVICID